MFNPDEFFAYAGTSSTPARKPTTAPTRRNLTTIRTQVMTAPKPVDLSLSNFCKPEPTPAAVKRQFTAVIRPEDNKPVRVVMIDSDATQIHSPLQLVKYSDYSFAVFGTTDETATKKYKDDLQSLGGKFNKWLKRDGKPTPGYIYPMWRKEAVLRYMERF